MADADRGLIGSPDRQHGAVQVDDVGAHPSGEAPHGRPGLLDLRRLAGLDLIDTGLPLDWTACVAACWPAVGEGPSTTSVVS